jgi:predicted nucleic acid-binding protein
MTLVLDTGILGQLCHPNKRQNRPVTVWLEQMLEQTDADVRVCLPEIADYELRRKLLHLARKGQTTPRAIERLDELATLFDYLPLDTATMRRAAQLWADAREIGRPSAEDAALDGDVILAAQAIEVGGTVVTTNRKHLIHYVSTSGWSEIHPQD